jgi:hypothetical protein
LIHTITKNDNNMENLAQNTVYFYEGSNQFASDKTHLNISTDYIQMILAKQYEYRPTTETLWADVKISGITQRFTFDYQTGLTLKFTF